MSDPADLRLSPRQIECLRLAAAGQTSVEIAATLGLSSRTVDQYVGEFIEKAALDWFNDYRARIASGAVVHQARGDAQIPAHHGHTRVVCIRHCMPCHGKDSHAII